MILNRIEDFVPSTCSSDLAGAARRAPIRIGERRRGHAVRSGLAWAVAIVLLVSGGTAQAPAITERPQSPAPGASTLERRAWLMGTLLHASVEAPDREKALAATEAAFGAVRRLEAVLSTWNPDAEMARLNRAPAGKPATVSPELFALLMAGEAWADATGRAFEPAVGSLVDAWDMRGEGRRPSEAELDEALAAVRAGVELLPDRRALRRRHEAAWIDTGGFGKGAALAAAGAALRHAGVERALLDFGGQVLAVGAPEAAEGWSVGVAHPRDRKRSVARLLVRDVSVATSGASERFVEDQGERLGHLLDPRTGHPVPAWGSVTVVAEDPLTADALSTALYVMGPEEGLRWTAGREDVGVLFLEDAQAGLRARWNGAMERWLRSAP